MSAKALSRSRIVLESPTLRYKVYGIAKQRQARLPRKVNGPGARHGTAGSGRAGCDQAPAPTTPTARFHIAPPATTSRQARCDAVRPRHLQHSRKRQLRHQDRRDAGLFGRQRRPYETTAGKGELKTPEIAGAARAYTMLISCTATEQAESAKR